MKITTATFLLVFTAGSLGVHGAAQAQNANPLACTVFPAGTSQGCTSNDPSSEYSVRLQVPNPRVTSYVWSHTDIDTGVKRTLSCTTSVCNFSVSANGRDIFWDIEAEENTGRNAATYSTTLDLAAVCGQGSYFC